MTTTTSQPSWWAKIRQVLRVWEKIGRWLLLVLSIVALLVVIWLLFEIFVYSWPIASGFDVYEPPKKPDTGYQRAKTLWDLLELLVIPLVLAAAGFFFNRTQQRNAESSMTQRAAIERELAERRTQDDVVEKYLDLLTIWLGDKQLPIDELLAIARMRTQATMIRLDGEHNGVLLRSLYNEDLLEILLSKANLRGVNLKGCDLREFDLQGADLQRANLIGAYLRKANLIGVKLRQANLTGANLREIKLTGANLEEANLEGAILDGAYLDGARLQRANLQGATLPLTHLQGANLYKANLQGANLQVTNLQGANLYEANLQGANLQGATMPDGSTHE